MFKIGNILIDKKIVLAPMAGISNPAYMKICEEMGIAYVVTELISAEAVVRNNPKTFDMLKGLEKITVPKAIQLFGANEKTLSQAAQILSQKYKIDMIDINMGCPVPKVAIKSGAGSALLKRPDQVRKIVKSVVEAVDIPVTVKIRSGWDEGSINAVEIAKICEESGASAIAIHGRTRSLGYSGTASWQIIKEVCDAVSIPVIGNGDVLSCYDAESMLKETGCAAVMIGRGLLGNPWLIKECNEYLQTGKTPVKVSLDEKIAMMKKHIKYLSLNQSEKITVLEMRSNLMHYLKGLTNTKDLKLQICRANKIEELITILDNYQKEYNLN